MRLVTLITTGGTIEKTYDELSGELSNRQTIVRKMLGELRLHDTEVRILEIMSKDSLEMTPSDRQRILDAVRLAGAEEPAGVGCDGLVILHGTDTLENTGSLLCRELEQIQVPVILTGAWRPFEMKRSDALQNLTEAIFATSVLEPGVYASAHGRALPFPNVAKNRQHKTFVGTDG